MTANTAAMFALSSVWMRMCHVRSVLQESALIYFWSWYGSQFWFCIRLYDIVIQSRFLPSVNLIHFTIVWHNVMEYVTFHCPTLNSCFVFHSGSDRMTLDVMTLVSSFGVFVWIMTFTCDGMWRINLLSHSRECDGFITLTFEGMGWIY